MCGIFFHLGSPNDTYDKEEASLIRRRGPDSINEIKSTVGTFEYKAVSSVLHLRGDSVVPQPLTDSRFIFQWNGEVYGGLNVQGNDTECIFKEIIRMDNLLNNLPELFSRINGEYAFVLLDLKEEILFYGRDYFGRRSLLQSIDNYSVTLSSIFIEGNGEMKEVPATGIWYIDLKKGQPFTANCIEWSYNGPLLQPIPKISRAPLEDDAEMSVYVEDTIEALKKSIGRRVLNIPFEMNNTAQVAILFSGGIDSVIMASVADLILPPETPIDLLNVAFENRRFLKNTSAGKHDIFLVPDRIAGIRAVYELRQLNPQRVWNFVQVNVSAEEYESNVQRVIQLMKPSNTVMDLSIAIALWFASRGNGILDLTNTKYISKAKVLLVGMGADEQLCGYSRHRSAYQNGGREATLDEIQMELDRISHRNLGRDDRCISDHGKEARYPFLDELFVKYLCELPLEVKADMRMEKGMSEKRLFRLMAKTLGFTDQVAFLPKKAIQFGAKTAKMYSSSESGADLLPNER